ncbi:MAG TPA: TRCF domain-containing protein, partial [Bacillota bacterium]
SNRVAYAYFTYRRETVLTEAAEKRLEALKDFTDFGSGFKLALRDLEIRGAGNLLGPEQHGFIASVGFDLYSQLLEEAVRELRGETEAPRLEPTIDLRWDAYIPDSYVRDARIKVDLYKRIGRVRTREDLAALRDELIDRFGEPPVSVWNLLLTADYRRRAAETGVIAITQEGKQLRLELVALPLEALRQAGLGDGRRGRRLEVRNGRPHVIAYLPDETRDTLRRTLNGLLSDLARVHGRADNGTV